MKITSETKLSFLYRMQPSALIYPINRDGKQDGDSQDTVMRMFNKSGFSRLLLPYHTDMYLCVSFDLGDVSCFYVFLSIFIG